MISATMLIVGTYLLIHQKLNIGQFVAAEIIILTIISSVEKIISNLDTFYDILTSLDKLHSIEELDKEQGGDYKIELDSEAIKIEFRDVDFSYIDNSPVFSNLSFVIDKGEKIVISGKDNSGKSSLIRLFSSIYQPTSGNILYNNIPTKNIDLNHFRSSIGLFLNHKGLINASILDNITFGNTTIPLKEVIHLSEQIGLSEFINKLPKGFETEIENTGSTLPQSIVKKILIARAFVNHQSLVLIEDPFSQLDDASIKKIKSFLIHEVKNKTLIVVSNDEEIIHSFDRNFHLIDKTLTIHSKK
jgi:ABC-type bacteriocin/lantibiotic exporter with double-glycine peptidase domain